MSGGVDDYDDIDWSGGAADPPPPDRPLLPALGHEWPLYRTDGLTYKEWKRARAFGKSIGASQLAAIMQRHPYSTPLSVASEIKGLAPVDLGPEETFRVELGRVCESQIRRIAAGHLDVGIIDVLGDTKPDKYLTTWPQVLRHPKIPCLTCNLDAVLRLPDEWLTVECKWTSWRNRAAWKALAEERDIRATIGTSVLAYYIQVQGQLAITGLKRGILIGIVGEDAACRMLMNVIQGRDGDDAFDPKPWDVIIVTVERDEAMIADIENVIPRFYRLYVEGDRLPAITNPERDLEALRLAHRADDPPDPLPIAPELDDLARRYVGVVRELSRGEKLRDQRKAELLHALTERNLSALTTGGYRVSYLPRVDGTKVFRATREKDPQS
ncbi:MAG: YqaJ viral recombinase family protein [Rhodanobacteraceae bacterium]|nr:YqaJ viral recombinase family protein [Rhodanobacteraceae bacterium]